MPSKHTKTVVLTDYQVGFLERLVKSGRYQNASEVVRDGLRALEVRVEQDEAAELAVIKDRIGRSLDQLDRREFVDGTIGEVFEQALADAQRRRRT